MNRWVKKIVLLLGITIVASSLAYLLQPTDIYTVRGQVTEVHQFKAPDVQIFFKVVPNCGCVKEPFFIFFYPEANDWSLSERTKLPFAENLARGQTLYFSNNVPQRGCPAKVYLLKNRWTKNFTRNNPVADLSRCK